ncbi:MAG TPA: hypothetical protein VHQ24_17115 [Lachnospiraceae bacterium]|nr:hypothetical protein [Lachnospiraceae bacterium]
MKKTVFKKLCVLMLTLCMAFTTCFAPYTTASAETTELELGELYQVVTYEYAGYLPQIMEFAGVLQEGFTDPATPYDFAKVTNIIKNDPTRTMSIVGSLNQTINKSSANYVEMGEALSNLLLTVLKCKLSDEAKASFTAAIQECFKSPNSSKSGFIFTKETASNCTYKCHLLYAIQDKSTGLFMYGLPISVTITVNKSKSKLFGITLKDKQNYSVNVQALEVVKLLKK